MHVRMESAMHKVMAEERAREHRAGASHAHLALGQHFAGSGCRHAGWETGDHDSTATAAHFSRNAGGCPGHFKVFKVRFQSV